MSTKEALGVSVAEKQIDQDTYTLDYSLWRCGSFGEEGVNALRTSEETKMMGGKGGMCCLGQFAAQKGAPEEVLLDSYEPGKVAGLLGGCYDPLFVKASVDPWDRGISFMRSGLATKAIGINDDPDTSIQHKITELASLLGSVGKKLKVINLPPHLSDQEGV